LKGERISPNLRVDRSENGDSSGHVSEELNNVA
jgi:hypothetical protein